MDSNRIEIGAEILAPKQRVWDLYTRPEHIVKWNFANNDWCCPSAENDLRVGGKYTARMEARDGSMGFDFSGTYTDVQPGERMTYRLDDGRRVDIDFLHSPQRTGTLVSIRFDPEGQNPITIQEQGWQAILNNFKKYADDQG